jgi:hypothetical protein
MKEIVEGLRLKMIAAGVRELSEVVGTAAN